MLFFCCPTENLYKMRLVRDVLFVLLALIMKESQSTHTLRCKISGLDQIHAIQVSSGARTSDLYEAVAGKHLLDPLKHSLFVSNVSIPNSDVLPSKLYLTLSFPESPIEIRVKSVQRALLELFADSPHVDKHWVHARECARDASMPYCNVCTWPGISCFENTQVVTSISLKDIGLSGGVHLGYLPSTVWKLDLSHNEISHVIIKALQDKELEVLDLEQNQIHQFDVSALKRSKVWSLNLGHNPIASIPFGDLCGASLHILNLQGNAEAMNTTLDLSGLSSAPLRELLIDWNRIRHVVNAHEVEASRLDNKNTLVKYFKQLIDTSIIW